MTLQNSDRLPPVFYHPSLLVVVDDCSSYCESIQFGMPVGQPIVTFDDPEEAIRWLRARSAVCRGNDPAITVQYDDASLSMERRVVKMDLAWIHRQACKADRFLHPSVVAVDFSMPHMTGLEFCAAIADLPCRRVLLTGTADEGVAVKGFNDGLIDRYLKKGDPNALEMLLDCATDLQETYFRGLSGTMREILGHHSFQFLSDPATMRIIGKLMARYGFVEYCLYPNPGGFLFLTATGEATLMVIETEASLLAHCEAAEMLDAPASLLQSLRSLQVVPYFWPGNGMYIPMCDDWEPYCLPAQTYVGRDTFYYALFSLPRDARLPEVYNFQRFLVDRDPLTHAG
jgi:CheY-like chemotaxis protein